jgi:hypothetical protein
LRRLAGSALARQWRGSREGSRSGPTPFLRHSREWSAWTALQRVPRLASRALSRTQPPLPPGFAPEWKAWRSRRFCSRPPMELPFPSSAGDPSCRQALTGRMGSTRPASSSPSSTSARSRQAAAQAGCPTTDASISSTMRTAGIP